jgi:hypothetical protein
MRMSDNRIRDNGNGQFSRSHEAVTQTVEPAMLEAAVRERYASASRERE